MLLPLIEISFKSRIKMKNISFSRSKTRSESSQSNTKIDHQA